MIIGDLYEKEYINIIQETVNNFMLIMIYSLHFNEKTKFGRKRIDDFMDDFMATVKGFSTGEFSPQEYEDMLENDGIHLKRIKE